MFTHSFLRFLAPGLVAVLMTAGCASSDTSQRIDTLDSPHVFLDSLEDRIQERFPLSDWGQTKTTLYHPEVEYSEETGGVWVRISGQTWNWDERRYRYSISMLTVPEINTDTGVVRLFPSREIIWDLDNVPRIYKQQVMDMTYPILMDAFHDQGFRNVRFKRMPEYHE